MDETTRNLKVISIEDGGSFCGINEESRSLVESNSGTSTEATETLSFNSKEAFVMWSVAIERAALSSLKKHASSGLEKEKRLKSVLKKREMKKKKKKKSRNGIIEAPPRISRNLERKIEEKGGRDIKLVSVKQLSSTDLHRSRLTMGGRKTRSKEEDYVMTGKEERSLSKMDVMMMEPCGEESRMVIDKLEMGNSEYYVLRRGWNGFVERNSEIVKVNDSIQVWSFRVDTQLWFAIDRHLRNDLCLGMDRLSL